MNIYRCPHCHDVIDERDLILSYECDLCGVEFNLPDKYDPLNNGVEVYTNKYKQSLCLYQTVCDTCRGAINNGVLEVIQGLKDGKLLKVADKVESEIRETLLKEVMENEKEREKVKYPPKKDPPIDIKPIEIEPIEKVKNG